MPAATSIEPFDKKQREQALDELKARREMIDSNWDYYEGKFKPQLVRDKNQDGTLGPDFNVYINLCKESVNATRDYLAPKMPTVQLDEDRKTNRDEQLVKDTLRDNGGESMLHEIFMQGATSGHCFVRTVPAEQNVKGAFVRLVPIDSRQIVIWWSDDDKDEILGYELYWGEDKSGYMGGMGGYKYMQLVINNNAKIAGVPDFWHIMDFERVNGNNWVLENDIDWQHDLSPIVSWPHLPPTRGNMYGTTEFTAKRLNDEVNFHKSNVKKILAFHGHPTTIAIGVSDVKNVKTGPSQIITISDKDAKVQNIEMQSDLTAAREEYFDTRAQFFRESQVVRLGTDAVSVGQLTNYAVSVVYVPMESKNTLLRNHYGNRGLAPLTRRILMLSGREWDVQPRIEWPSSLPVNATEQIAVDQQELALGITSRKELAEKRGRDYEKIKTELEAEQAAMDIGMGLGAIGISA